MSKYAINPNALPDIAAEQAAALDRDRAAIHHFDDDGAGDAALPKGAADLGSLMVMPDPRYRHGDVDVIEAQLAARKAQLAARKTKGGPVSQKQDEPPYSQAAVDHPMIATLFAALPPPGQVWPAQDRANWFRAAESIFGLVYRSETDEQES